MSDATPATATTRKLSREGILEAALTIADREGLSGLTMRRLAAELGSAPMSIYRYFKNKAEIEATLLDHVIGATSAVDHEAEDWRAWTRTAFITIRRSLLDHPGVLPLLGTAASFGPQGLRSLNSMLGHLREAGLDDPKAVRAYAILMHFTLGSVVAQAGAERSIRSLNEKGSDVAILLPDPEELAAYANVMDLANEMTSQFSDEGFESALDLIISGL